MNDNGSAFAKESRKCHHEKIGGGRCGAHARHGSQFCFIHDPASAADRDVARKKGGEERSRKTAVLPANTPDKPLATAADVQALLAETINQVRRGQVDPRISNAVGYLAGILLKATVQHEFERRLSLLESVVGTENPTVRSDLEPDPDFDEFTFVNRKSGEKS